MEFFLVGAGIYVLWRIVRALDRIADVHEEVSRKDRLNEQFECEQENETTCKNPVVDDDPSDWWKRGGNLN